MSIKCPECHFENPDDTLYCGKCATPLLTSEEVTFPMTKTLETPLKELARGTTFAKRYEFVEELGRGGMGRVYKVFDKKIKEEVAIKILKPEIASDETTIERFGNELKLARKIVHKNVGRMYELMEEEGAHFITMEYVAGEDLKSFIKRVGQLPIGKSISIAKQVCEGLIEAHKLGVVHRDLKPGNIMIDKEGNARIMDFGIARSLKREGITTKGVVVGTPDYMSPEQVEGKGADQRSDIYSLGIVLYEMLTGKVPFEGDTSLSIALKHKTEMPRDPRELNAEIPENLSRLILKCLEKKRENRYQSVNELLEELEQAKVDETRIKQQGRRFKFYLFKKRIKERRPSKIKSKVLKYSLRAFFGLLIVYGVISIISLINDAVYGAKLKEVKIEADTYYKNLYPIQKDWLPEEWQTRNRNAYNAYMKLFPPKFQDEEGNPRTESEYMEIEYVNNIVNNPTKEELDKVFSDFEYKDIQELKAFVEKYGKFYEFDDFFDAVKCTKLDPSQLIENDYQFLNTTFILKYAKMMILQSRVDFFEGNYEQGLERIHAVMIFALDRVNSSYSLISSLVTNAIFRWLYRELIPLFLSNEASYSHPVINHLERLISLYLIKEKLEQSLYEEYLWIGEFGVETDYGIVRPDTYDDIEKFNYYLYAKFHFWKNGFSWNRYLYEAVEFYQGLFEGLKYIRNDRDKSIYIKDFYEKNFPEEHLLVPSYNASQFKFNITRTLGKLVLAILSINKHSLGSPEFLKLEGTNAFINELSGKKFEIVKEGEEFFIILDEEYKLSLNKIDYQKDHREILESFSHFFDLKTVKQIRSLFYSFELE